MFFCSLTFMLSCILRFMSISQHPCILVHPGSCVLVGILALSHPYILRFMCACFHPCILASYAQVPLYLVVSLHRHIMLYYQVCVCLLVSSHLHILIPSCSCLLVGTLTSLIPQVHVFLCALLELTNCIDNFINLSHYFL